MKFFILLWCLVNTVSAATLSEVQKEFTRYSNIDDDTTFIYGKPQYEHALATLRNSYSLYKDHGFIEKRVDLRDRMTPVKNQDERGACCVFAVVGLYEACLKRFFPNEPHILSEQAYLSFFDKDGNNADSVRKIIEKKGFIWDSPLLPYTGTEKEVQHYRSTRTCEVAAKLPRKQYRLQQELGAVEWGCIPIMNYTATADFGLMLINLSRMKMPMVAYLHTACDDWLYSNGNIKKLPSKQYIERRGGYLGHHAVLITGYDLDKELLFFKNSWGTDWGDEGYGTITFEAFAAHHGDANLNKNYGFLTLMFDSTKSKCHLWGFDENCRVIS